jgi:hypothetical protein
VVAKKGDVFVTHGMLPHSHSPNHLHYARVITNPHVNLSEPFNLSRKDGDYVGNCAASTDCRRSASRSSCARSSATRFPSTSRPASVWRSIPAPRTLNASASRSSSKG